MSDLNSGLFLNQQRLNHHQINIMKITGWERQHCLRPYRQFCTKAHLIACAVLTTYRNESWSNDSSLMNNTNHL